MNGEFAEGVRSPHVSLRSDRSSHKHEEDGNNGLPSMLNLWWVFGVSLHEKGNGDWNLLSGADAEAGTIPGVRCGAGGRIPDDAPPGEAHFRMG